MRALAVACFAFAALGGRATAQPTEHGGEPARRDSEININIAACLAEAVPNCWEAADELERLHVTSRNGHTPSELRARAEELLERHCTAGDGAACFEQGKRRALTGRHGNAEDAAVGRSKIERACTLKHGDACAYLGDAAKQAKAALALFEQACAAGSGHGCEQLALRLGAADRSRIAELHHRACAADDLSGCLRSGELRQARGDRAGAAVDLEAACDLGELAACDRAGVLASEPVHARELFKRACNARLATGCSHLADFVATGNGGERDWGAGIDLAEHACTIAKSSHCGQAAQLRSHRPDATCSTEEACRRLCDERIGESCATLAQLVAPAQRQAVYSSGCENGDGASCAVVGDAESAPDAAMTFYGKGCKLGDSRSCTYARYADAQHGSHPARDALRRACAKDLDACVLLGLAVESTDIKTAEQLWREACGRKAGPACRLAAHGTASFALRSADSFDGDALCWRRDGDVRKDPACLAETVRLMNLACAAKDARACQELDPHHQHPEPALELPVKTPRWE